MYQGNHVQDIQQSRKHQKKTVRSTYEANAAAEMGQMSLGGGHKSLRG